MDCVAWNRCCRGVAENDRAQPVAIAGNYAGRLGAPLDDGLARDLPAEMFGDLGEANLRRDKDAAVGTLVVQIRDDEVGRLGQRLGHIEERAASVAKQISAPGTLPPLSHTIGVRKGE